MRFLHLGDLHLGKIVNEFSMLEDQRYILEEILRIIDEKKVDGLLIAGDVYDKSIPSEEAVRLLDWFLNGMVERGVPVYMISGNHDSDERLNFGSSILASRGVCIAAKYEGRLTCYEMEDAYGKVQICLLPFVKASRVRHFHPEATIESYDDAVRVALAELPPDPEVRRVLVAHQFVVGDSGKIHADGEAAETAAVDDMEAVGGEMPELAGSEGSMVAHVGTVEQVGSSCFDGFDYVALGHIHSPQRVGRDEIRYSGSPLKYSLSEINNSKSVPLITLGPDHQVEIELLPLKPLRDMRHLKGPMECLLDRAHVQDPEDYIYVTLTDEDMVMDAMNRIRQVYPNTMKLDYQNRHTVDTMEPDYQQVTKEKSFREIAGDFYRQMYGCEMSEREEEILLEIAGRIGLGR